MTKQDMADLIRIRDAYESMNKSLLGKEVALLFHEGYLGELGRIFQVIDRNVSDKCKQDDDGPIKILDTVSLTPEERAKLVLGLE